jgi:hypothetical protein
VGKNVSLQMSVMLERICDAKWGGQNILSNEYIYFYLFRASCILYFIIFYTCSPFSNFFFRTGVRYNFSHYTSTIIMIEMTFLCNIDDIWVKNFFFMYFAKAVMIFMYVCISHALRFTFQMILYSVSLSFRFQKQPL